MYNDNMINTYTRFDVVFEKGSGPWLYDANGKKYLDFVAGIAVNCLGHSHPAIIEAIGKQSKKLIHVSNLYWNQPQIELAEKLAAYSDHKKVFFTNSGAEAVETALKLARKYGKLQGGEKKQQILYMKNSFHGRTLGALAVTGQEKYQKDFMPLMKGVESVFFNDIDDLRSKVSENTCGIILEPIQGEGGIIPAEKSFLQEARRLCDKVNALLIFDEIQCGIGRTGNLFAYQKFDVTPDVICLAKGLAGGFPIGAVLATEKAASAFSPGDHGCTFGGNPLACATSLVVLEELMEQNVIEGVTEKSIYLKERLNKLKTTYPIIKEIRGIGLMLGICFDCDIKPIVGKCFENGLLVVGAGTNVIRLVPPLNVKIEEIDKAIEILQEVLNKEL
jgi:acetylornithine/N-succinyldiaminopimelate aminotransferase